MAEQDNAPALNTGEPEGSGGSSPSLPATTPGFKRIHCNTVSETLIHAAEHADKMENVIVIYEARKDNEDCDWGLFVDGGMTFANLNLLLDRVKKWILD